ncbi:MAG: YbaK/EbsC family protein [Gammaproteobacteria bacterium]|nr:YbaK/EbsC family protein [Gammaproteobacteria bacterium]
MPQITKYLKQSHIHYQSQSHPLAYTAQQIAEQSNVSGLSFCKTVIVIADGKLSMIVMSAPYTIDFNDIAKALNAKQVNLAYEHQFRNVFPDCETGAMPPFGNLFDIPVYMHDQLAAQSIISFNAGNHLELLQIKATDFIGLVEPTIISTGISTVGTGYEHQHSRQGMLRHLLDPEYDDINRTSTAYI